MRTHVERGADSEERRYTNSRSQERRYPTPGADSEERRYTNSLSYCVFVTVFGDTSPPIPWRAPNCRYTIPPVYSSFVFLAMNIVVAMRKDR
jgi:hypothetical protein